MIQSVDRALHLLAAIRDRPGVSLTELSGRVGLLPSTASRLLGTLERHGYVERDAGKAYRIGPEALRLAAGASPEVDLPTRLGPVVRALAAKAREQTSLAALEGHQVRHLLVIDGAAEAGEDLILSPQTGARDANLNATALGKVFLAFGRPEVTGPIIDALQMPKTASRTITDPAGLRRHLDRVRRAGHALSLDENTDHVRGVAAPVWRAGGSLACALAVHGPTIRLSRARLRELARTVHDAADQCSITLGFTGDRRSGAPTI